MHETRLANLLGAAVPNLSDRMTAAAGVSLSGTAALVVLAESPGLGGTELGQRIGLSQPACARMLDQLEARGLVRQQAKSGRAVGVVLTRAGRAAANRAAAGAGRRTGCGVRSGRSGTLAGTAVARPARRSPLGRPDVPACASGSRTSSADWFPAGRRE